MARAAVAQVVLALVGVLLVGVDGARAQADAPIFTVAGGGRSVPVDGMVATDARLAIERVAATADGYAFVQAEPFSGNPVGAAVFRVDSAGRLRRLPALPQIAGDFGTAIGPADLDSRADGTLLVALADRLFELRPDAVTWQPLAAFAGGAVDGVVIDSVAVASDHTLWAGADRTVWHLAADGRPLRRHRVPGLGDDEFYVEGLTALPGGGFAYNATPAGTVVRFDGTAYRRITDRICCEADLAALPDGSLLRAALQLRRLPAAGTSTHVSGAAPGLGLGDGGPASAALIEPVTVDATATGAWVIGDNAPLDPLGALDRPGYEYRGRIIVPAGGAREGSLLRAGGGPSLTPAVAILPSTYTTLSQGVVGYTTTFAGETSLLIRRGRRLVARVVAPVAAGSGLLSLPTVLAQAGHRLELRVTDGTRTAAHRIAVDLTRTLARARAVRLARRFAEDQSAGGDAGGGSFERAVGCRRDGVRRFTCARLLVIYGDAGDETRCTGVVAVVLRRDGARAYNERDIPRCRRLARDHR